MQLTFDIMYQALVEKDTAFEGVFYTAVKTTGIFCRPSCTARKPKPENVEFFSSAKECLQKGYRPCKVCKPLDLPNETPAPIRQLLDDLANDPSLKIKDFDLVQRGLEPARIRRWFLKNHGITFQAYQRMMRINTAFKKIQQGESVTHAAFDAGFDSLSGFGESFKNLFGVSPKNGRQQRVVDLKRLETPLGTMIACAVEEGICLLEFSDRKMLETELKTIARQCNATITVGNNPHFEILEQQLAEYFVGERSEFTVPLYTQGTPFQQRVWEALRAIPYGETRSYKQQAETIGSPESVRAVANANGMNRIAIIIPCHRVIGSDGQLTGYAGGLWRKQRLLEMESRGTRLSHPYFERRH